MGDDGELTDDIVGVTSARLLADGVPAEERRLALRLLSVLLAVADAEGRVRRPLVQLAGEFELPDGDVEGWVDALEATGAVAREAGGVRLAARERDEDDAFQLHDFLAIVDELDGRDERPVPARRSVGFRPVGSVLAAAAVLVAALLAPAIVRSSPTTPAASVRGAERRTPPAAAVAEAPDPATTTTSVVEVQAAPEVPVVSSPGAAPVATTTTTTTPLLPCPTGIPTLDVTGATTRGDGHLAVTGIVRNASTQDLAVQSFTLRTTVAPGQDLTVAGLDRPLVVPAGSSVVWDATIPVAAPPGAPVRATLGDWEWRGAPLDCPSP